MSRQSIYEPRQSRARKDLFPLLDVNEIYCCLIDCGFEITEELINKPNKDFVCNLYENLIDIYMGIPQGRIREKAREFSQRPDPSMVQYQEITGNVVLPSEEERNANEPGVDYSSLYLILLRKYMARFLITLGIDDLCLGDLAKPDGYRFRRILSAVINFLRFREEKNIALEELAEKCEAKEAEIEETNEKNRALLNKINTLKRKLEFDSATEEKRSNLQQINAYNRKLEKKLRELKSKQEVLTKKHEVYKQEKKSAIEKLNDLDYIITELQDKISDLKKYSETDIANTVKIIEKLSSDLENSNAELQDMERKYQNAGITIDSIQVSEIASKDLIRVAEEVLENIEKREIEVKILNGNKAQLESLGRKQIDLQGQLQLLEAQVKKSEKYYHDLLKQAEVKDAAMKERLEEQKQEFSKALIEKSDHSKEHKRILDQITRVEQDTARCEEEFVKQTNEYIQKMQILSTAFTDYMNDLKNAI
ncbi:putative kinetochore protein NUF2 [Candida maltosa Xu316]|uniref:Putative kinetochore protein NUF2 n=1 Tax=Candida maltosa (strain Xu316) TaxID=1245528 RepID=M3J3C8_CANMX|nr:putative kinetochore protein NUF2 [Candida maltosa Xu316]